MHPRASDLIRQLGLEPHPEGGFFRRTYRSQLEVMARDARGPRAALTAIYFLLGEHGISRWHRVASDETWHWYEGARLELLTAPANGGPISARELGPLVDGATPQHSVQADCWQAARCLGDYTLVGCSVGPGFDFADFTLLAALPENERPPLTPVGLLAEFL
jgi:predicted cupin superfamily sugar epimerase